MLQNLKLYSWSNSSKQIVKLTPYCYQMHYLTSIDKVFQLRNALRNISDHSKKCIFLFDWVSQIRFIFWREALRLFP